MIEVDATPEEIVVRAESRYANLIAQIPGLRDREGAWRGPVRASTMLALASELGRRPDFRPTDAATDLMQRVRFLRERVAAEKDTCEALYDERLYDYQRAGVWLLVERRGACLLDEMGVGKTATALAAARAINARRILVVCPNSMKYRWAREAETWYPEAATYVLDGTAAHKRNVMDLAIEDAQQGLPVLVTVNWESLRTLTRIAGYGSHKLTSKDLEEGPLNSIEWDCVIADEVHRAKDPKSKQTRALWYVSRGAEYRWGLTGTAVLNTPGDLWAIGRFYDPDTYTDSRHKWHNFYVDYEETPWGPKDIGLRPDRERAFHAWFDLNTIRRTKAEVLDLPPITYQTRELELTSKQRTAYNKMVKDMIALIDDDFLVANNPLTLLARLSQIASATPVVEEMQVTALDMPSNKVTAALEILDEIGDRQVVFFAQSRKLIDLLCSELERKGVSVVRITGTENAAMRDVAVEQFQAGEVQVAACTLGAGSEGINLYAADTAVFLQRSYAYGQNQQAESRIHRNGQEAEHVTIIDLVSKETVDEAVLDALQSKAEMAEQVLRDQARQLLREKAT